MVLKEGPPALVAAQPHALDLARLEGVHRDGPDEGYVDPEAAMDARARQTDKDAELGRRPLRAGGVAVAADAVVAFFLDRQKLRCEEKEKKSGK